MKHPKFLVGLLIGGLLGLIIWYWQKSTSAEDGALDLLDRLAAEARARDLTAQYSAAAPPAEKPEPPEKTTAAGAEAADSQDQADDLRQITGIGPTYARRLQEAGIHSFAALAALAPEAVMELSAVRSAEMAEAWIEEARRLASG